MCQTHISLVQYYVLGFTVYKIIKCLCLFSFVPSPSHFIRVFWPFIRLIEVCKTEVFLCNLLYPISRLYKLGKCTFSIFNEGLIINHSILIITSKFLAKTSLSCKKPSNIEHSMHAKHFCL